MDTIEIKLSKRKISLLIVGSALFIILGYFMITNADTYSSNRHSPEVVTIAGYVSLFFFSVSFLFGIVKIFDNKPGLIINEKGIINNASGVNAGFIAWNDITNITTIQVKSAKFLLIYTKNPDIYIQGQNRLKAYMMQMNYKMYGTPLSIPSTTLNYKFGDLKALLLKEFQIRKPL